LKLKYVRQNINEWETFLSIRAHHNLYVNSLVYKTTIKAIRRIAEPGDLILEAGCGSGRTAMLLGDMGYRVFALDRSLGILSRLCTATSFINDLNLINADIRHIPFGEKVFKVAYSCEVLEHFDPPEIVKILNEQRKVSFFLIVDVPNDRCTKRSFGDERFYTDEEWYSMFKEAGLEIRKTLHRGMDNGRYIGNCSIFLAADKNDKMDLSENIDVYDYY
jgi:SAM-dependent methyltransferase